MNTVSAPEGMPQLQMSQDSIPDLLKIGSIPSNQEANITTEILQPVNFSDSSVRFQLNNVGFLNPYSRITFSLDQGAGTNARSFYPLSVGVASLIKSVTLKIGSQTIQSISDFQNYTAYKSLFINNEVQKEREAYLSSRQICHQQFYDDTTNILVNKDNCQHLVLDNGREYESNASGVTSGIEAYDFQLLINKPTFSITLEELLPMFRNTAFPLYMLNKDMPVQIEIDFSANNNRFCMNGCGTLNQVVDFTVNRNECRMIADYTTYPQDLMDAYAAKNKSMSWSFMDYQLTKLSLANSAAGQNIIRNIGGAGRLVPRAFVSIENIHANPEEFLLSTYTSEANASTALAYGQLTTNIKKNSNFIYPIDRKNTSLHFHSLADAEGMVPFILRGEYSRQGGRIGDELFERRHQDENLEGKFFHVAYKMPDGERVDSQGLELNSQMRDLPAGQYTLRAYIECIKVATLNDGRFDCYFA
jgi:hypothetical protein